VRGSRYLGSALIGLIYLFLLAPFLIVLISSFNASPFLTFPPQGFSLQWYARIFTNPDFMAAFRRSVSVAAIVSALDLALGVSAALSLVRGRFAGRDLLSTFFMADSSPRCDHPAIRHPHHHGCPLHP
jgi:putative spermidine/putrescine transport system permease protein